MNVHRLVKILLLRPDVPPTVADQRKLVAWLVFCARWPGLVDDVLRCAADQPARGQLPEQGASEPGRRRPHALRGAPRGRPSREPGALPDVRPGPRRRAGRWRGPPGSRGSCAIRRRLLSRRSQRRPIQRLRQQHLLREDEIAAVVVRHLVVVAHGDRVERARDLAVAAEDAAREVDLVDRGVALARRSRGSRACSRRRPRGCSRPGRRPRRASSRRTSPAPCPRTGAACGGRGSAGRPGPSPRGTGSSSGPRPCARTWS